MRVIRGGHSHAAMQGNMEKSQEMKEFEIEYESRGRVYLCIVEAWSREEAIETFEKEHPHWTIRDCWAKNEN